MLLRAEDEPEEDVAVIRGGEHGVDLEMLGRTASRTHTEFGYYGVSVYLALASSIEELCAAVPALRRYGQIRVRDVGRLRGAGFALLPTGPRPHFSIVLADMEEPTLDRLAGCFGPGRANPGKAVTL